MNVVYSTPGVAGGREDRIMWRLSEAGIRLHRTPANPKGVETADGTLSRGVVIGAQSDPFKRLRCATSFGAGA